MWGERLSDLRNKAVRRPGFRRLAKRLPLFRGVARRDSRALFDLMAGFVYTQTLLACTEAGVFDALTDGPQSVETLADRASLSTTRTERLLRAAASLDLVEPRAGGRYALGRLGAALSGEPGLSAMIEHHRLLYDDLADPLSVLREGRGPRLSAFWGYARAPGEAGESRAYSALMAATLPLLTDEIFTVCRPRRHRRLLDVGGGHGAFAEAAAARAPRLDVALFDLPEVAGQAKTRLDAAGLGERVEVHGGSFLADPLPPGADLISLIRILHDHDDEAAQRLLCAVREAAAPGGTILIAEPLAEARGAEPMGEAYFGWYLTAMGGGRPRSAATLSRMLREAGFVDVRVHPSRMPVIAGLITARSPNT